jgi:hypothetical protein
MLNNEHAYNVLAFIILLSYLLVIKFSESVVTNFMLCFFIYTVFQVTLGIYQIVNYGVNQGEYLTGSFLNSGIYACYLVISLPICCFVIAEKFKNKKRIAPLITLLSVVFSLIIMTQSRSALMGFAVLVLISAYYYRHILLIFFGKNKYFLSVFAVLLILVVILKIPAILEFKTLSAYGRILIWKISVIQMADHLLLGVGLGNFSYYYPLWQADYLAAHRGYGHSFLSAGPSFTAFNEFLSYFIELGIIRFLMICYLVFRVFQMENKRNPRLAFVLKFVIFLALICGLTTYILHSTIALLLLTYAIAILVKDAQWRLPF